MDALCNITDRCIDDTVAELSLARDVLRDVILAFIVNQHFIDIHFDDIPLHNYPFFIRTKREKFSTKPNYLPSFLEKSQTRGWGNWEETP